MAFDRVANLYVGKMKNGNEESASFRISDLHFSFEVTRSIYWFENKARFSIYNLSKENENKIMTEGSSVIFEAGHKDQKIGNIYIGQIGYVDPRKKGLDRVTEIFCTSGRGGQYQLSRVGISIKFSAGTFINTVLEYVATYCGLSFKGRENLGDVLLERDLVYSGDVAKLLLAIRDTVLYRYGAGAYIDNNEIVIYRLYGDVSEFNYAYLTKSSGLLTSARVRDESKNEINYREDLAYWMGYPDLKKADIKVIEEKLAKQKAEKEELNKRECIKLSSLIRADIYPNTMCEVIDEEEKINGRYIITRAIYSGDNFGGEFKVECEAMK